MRLTTDRPTAPTARVLLAQGPGKLSHAVKATLGPTQPSGGAPASEAAGEAASDQPAAHSSHTGGPGGRMRALAEVWRSWARVRRGKTQHQSFLPCDRLRPPTDTALGCPPATESPRTMVV